MNLFRFSPPKIAGTARKLGFINSDGDIVIEPQYAPHPHSCFNSAGYCVVNTPKYEKLSIIDQSNQTCLTVPNDHQLDFMTPPDSHGIFAVRHLLDKDDPSAYTRDHREQYYHGRTRHYAMNLQGEVVFEEEIRPGVNGFYELSRPGKDGKDKCFGIINHMGEITVPAQFDRMGWSDTSPYVSVLKNGLCGVIDTQGNEIIPISLPLRGGQYIPYVIDDVIIHYDAHRDMARTINLNGELLALIPPTYSTKLHPKVCPHISDGLIMINVKSRFRKNGTYYVDVYGNNPMRGFGNQPKMFPPEYQMSNFREGMATYRVNGQMGYINKSGAIAIEAQYFNGFPFSNGLAKVYQTNEDSLADRFSYINKNGDVVACNH